MSQWAHEHPEEYAEIAALPPSQQNAAMREAIGYDADAIRDQLDEAQQLERDANLYGFSVVDENGKRVDPTEISPSDD
jgi:hypothetical protein